MYAFKCWPSLAKFDPFFDENTQPHFNTTMAQSSLCHFPTNCLHWPLFTRFCQSKGPNNLNSTTKTLTIGFNSNAKEEGEGAECSVACSDLTPTSGTLVWESSDQLKHYLRWVGRRRRVIKTVPASQPKGYPSMCEGVYCDKDQLGWGRLTRIFKVQRHILVTHHKPHQWGPGGQRGSGWSESEFLSRCIHLIDPIRFLNKRHTLKPLELNSSLILLLPNFVVQ